MKRTLTAPLLVVGANIAAISLVAATALLSASAFASGYGPQPSYNPLVGAPASQRGPGVQAAAAGLRTPKHEADAHGGTPDARSESGRRVLLENDQSPYAHS